MAGIPHADILVYVAGIAEMCGGLSLLFGFLTRVGALGLFLFLIPTTLVFHHFWNMTGVEAKTQMVNFMKNLAIVGGLLAIWASGAGKYSIDHRIRKPLQP